MSQDENKTEQQIEIALQKKDIEFLTKQLNTITIQLSELIKSFNDFKTANLTHRRECEDIFVTQVEFKPVKGIVYGMVGTILIAIIGALLMLVIK